LLLDDCQLVGEKEGLACVGQWLVFLGIDVQACLFGRYAKEKCF
jgi:hypothetical protein